MIKALNVQFIADSSYIMGENVEVGVVISNYENRTVYIHKPATYHGFLRYDCFSVRKTIEEKPYHGALFYFTKESIFALESNKSLSFNVSIAKEYLLDESGVYTIELKSNRLLVDSADNVTLNSSRINFDFFIQDHSPVKTYVELTQKLAKSNIKCESFGNKHCVYNVINQKEFNDTQKAHYTAQNYLSYTANNIADPLPNSFKVAYESMFCKNNYSAINDLQNKYKAMHSYMDDNMKYWHRAQHCEEGDFGYIFPADTQKDVYLCSMYEKAQIIPNAIKNHDSKAGVIIHEVSHKAAGTDDHFYSYNNCKAQAFECNPLTVSNADCMQIFVELVALQNITSIHDEL